MSHFPDKLSERIPGDRRERAPVLVAVGTSGGMTALDAARGFAAREEVDVVVVSVVEPPPIYTFESNRALLLPWLIEQQIAERQYSVQERVDQLGIRGARGEPRIEVVYGDPAREIARLARLRGASLIIMGIGPHAPGHRLLGSGTAAATSRRAHCPVLAVGEHSRALAHVAVIATDFSPESVHAAQTAVPLLADGADVYLVHAWNALDVRFPSAALVAWNEAYAASLPERFAQVRSAIDPTDSLAIHTLAREGKPAAVVLEVARSKRADLIVAATHGRGGFQRWLLGSTSTALLRGAECSVLLTPAPPLAQRLQLDRQMRGTSTSADPAEWNEELQTFIERNRNRRTRLEIHDPSIGAQVQETGYGLVGAAYDPHDARLALMFGDARGGEAHLTHSLGSVRSVSVRSGARDRDAALYIESGESGALLTFLPAPPSASSGGA